MHTGAAQFRRFVPVDAEPVPLTLGAPTDPMSVQTGRYRTVQPESACPPKDESESDVYAIVRAGGRQEKVSVGDVLIIDKLAGEAGDRIDLTPLLLVDGSDVTSDAAKLAKVKVTAEIVQAAK